MSLPDLEYSVRADDEFSRTFDKLDRQIAESDRLIAGLTRSLETASRRAERAATETAAAFRELSQGPNLKERFDQIAGFTIGGFAAVELAQRAVAYTKYSVEVKRTEEAFNLLSGSVALAEAKLEAIQRASDGSINGMAAMQIANKATALGLASTGKELERVTRLATITGRVMGVDVATALDNITSASANLSFERLDQMGISASQVRARFNELRDLMGTNEAFLQATLEVGERTFGALNDSALTAASGVETLSRAWADFLAGLTGPGSQIDTFLVNALGTGTVEDNITRLQQRLEELQNLGPGMRLLNDLGAPLQATTTDRLIETMPELIRLMEGMSDATLAGVDGAAAYSDELDQIAVAALTGALSEDQIARMGAIAEWWGIIGEGALFAANAISAAGDASRNFAPPALGMTPGQFALQRYRGNQTTEDIQSGIRDRQRNEITAQLDEQLRTTRAVNEAQFRLALASTDTAGQIAMYEARLAQLEAGTVEAINTETQIVGLKSRLADQTEKAGGRFIASLSNLESAFDSALAAIPGIPGSGGRTQVTEDDLRLAAAGLYRDKPDEFLRRAEDLLINRNQRDDVSRAMIEQAVAASTGFDIKKLGGLQGDLLFKLLEEEFTSARLFGTEFGRMNFDSLINQQGIAFGLQQQGQANLGRQFLETQFKGGALPGIFANAGGFAGQLEEQLNNTGFAAQVGSIFNSQLTSDKSLTLIDNAAPVITSRLESAILDNAEGGGIGYRLISLYLKLMQEAEIEVTQ